MHTLNNEGIENAIRHLLHVSVGSAMWILHVYLFEKRGKKHLTSKRGLYVIQYNIPEALSAISAKMVSLLVGFLPFSIRS